MNFTSILSRSFEIARSRSYLWLLGILLGAPSAYNFFQFGGGNSSNETNQLNEPGGNLVKAATEQNWDKVFSSPINLSTSEIITIAVISILLFCLLIYLTLTAKGAVTLAGMSLDRSENPTLSEVWKKSRKLLWRRISFSLTLFLITVVPLFILAVPVILLAIWQQLILAVIIGILFGLVFFAYIIYLGFFTPIAERVLFVEGLSAKDSLLKAKTIFNNNWLSFVLLYLILFGIGLVYLVVMAFAFFFGGGLIFGISYLFYMFSHLLGYILGGVLLTILVISLLIFAGFFNSFSWTMLTLGYKDTRKL